MSEERLKTARVLSVVAATIISLACGTNYAYSAWAPEFAERLKLSSTQSNLIGTFGNLGMYIAGIPIGILVDSKGPKPGVLLGALSLGTGYFSIYRAYEAGPDSVQMPWLCLSAFLTGIGGCAAFAGSVKTSALNWPNNRGTATAFPLSGFGLSAFFFSTISSLAFPDNTSDLLLLLAVSTFSMCCVSGFFLRVIPLSPSHITRPTLDARSSSASSTLLKQTISGQSRHRAGRLSIEPGTQPESTLEYNTSKVTFEEPGAAGRDTETSSLLSKSSGGSSPSDVPYQDNYPRAQADHNSHRPDIKGLALLSRTKFYQLWLMLGLLTGIGLMTINNIGNDVGAFPFFSGKASPLMKAQARALWRHYDDSVSPTFIQERQLMHVEILSVMSFIGRLTSGVGSDLIVSKLHMSRFWCLFISSSIFLLAQVSGALIQNPNLLSLVSGPTGLAYGFLFGVFPALVAETFGLSGFSQNWGTMTLAPIVSGNTFNLIYGSIYDKHSVIGGGGARDCREGLGCYRRAYWVTLGASMVGVGISLWSIRSDWVGRVRERREREGEREA